MENKIGKIAEFMTVGEVAEKMRITVRTLQYYDKIGLLPPSSCSEGGRRLYTDRDLVKLHQILSLKYLGFSLEEIKNKLISLNTPFDVAEALSEQAEKIAELSESLKALKILKEEVLQMQSVDFKKYADIIVNLQMKNKYYWIIKHFDEPTLNKIRGRFDKESSMAFVTLLKKYGGSIDFAERKCSSKQYTGTEACQKILGYAD